MKVEIDGVDYVPRNDTPLNDEVMGLLRDLYGKIWTEACYDPDNMQSEKYARRLLPGIQKLNELLHFKR